MEPIVIDAVWVVTHAWIVALVRCVYGHTLFKGVRACCVRITWKDVVHAVIHQHVHNAY